MSNYQIEKCIWAGNMRLMFITLRPFPGKAIKTWFSQFTNISNSKINVLNILKCLKNNLGTDIITLCNYFENIILNTLKKNDWLLYCYYNTNIVLLLSGNVLRTLYLSRCPGENDWWEGVMVGTVKPYVVCDLKSVLFGVRKKRPARGLLTHC